jgi:hypothetical protein
MTIWTAVKMGIICPACLRHWFDNDVVCSGCGSRRRPLPPCRQLTPGDAQRG